MISGRTCEPEVVWATIAPSVGYIGQAKSLARSSAAQSNLIAPS